MPKLSPSGHPCQGHRDWVFVLVLDAHTHTHTRTLQGARGVWLLCSALSQTQSPESSARRALILSRELAGPQKPRAVHHSCLRFAPRRARADHNCLGPVPP